MTVCKQWVAWVCTCTNMQACSSVAESAGRGMQPGDSHRLSYHSKGQLSMRTMTQTQRDTGVRDAGSGEVRTPHLAQTSMLLEQSGTVAERVSAGTTGRHLGIPTFTSSVWVSRLACSAPAHWPALTMQAAAAASHFLVTAAHHQQHTAAYHTSSLRNWGLSA